jgi:type VI secretion system secreted protein Hcp
MAVDMFLKIDGVDGESADKKNPKQIDVLSWSWGASNNGSAHHGTGAGSGKVSVQDVLVTKYVDSSSPKLLLACFAGTHYPNALLSVRKAGGDSPVEYFKIKMQQVFVTSVSTGGHGGEDRLTENVTLNFSKVNVDYTPQTDKGGSGTAIPFSWDIAANSKEA